MKRIWKQSLYRVTVWLAAEIILNCLGIDNLADYSEFVFEHNTIDFDSSYPFSKTSAKFLFGDQISNEHKATLPLQV